MLTEYKIKSIGNCFLLIKSALINIKLVRIFPKIVARKKTRGNLRKEIYIQRINSRNKIWRKYIFIMFIKRIGDVKIMDNLEGDNKGLNLIYKTDMFCEWL